MVGFNRKNDVTMKKQYNGLDLLKFVMALMVVMIHVKPNTHSEFLTTIFKPILSIAVPMFFTISSVLLFRYLKKSSDLFKYIKRIGILYACWLLIDGWFIVVRKPYFGLGFVNGVSDFFLDLVFGTTFPGSWYLSASAMGVLAVYFLSRAVNKYIVFLITLLIALYVSYANQLPPSMQLPYEWYSAHFRKEVTLSFPAQMIWISLGQILSQWLSKIEDKKRILMPLSIGIFAVAFSAKLFLSSFFLLLIMVLSLFIFFLLIELKNSDVYKHIRNYSILIFFFHFSIAGKMGMFCNFCGDTLVTNWLYYILVIAVSIAFAETILRLEKYKYLKFLRYIH